VTASPLGGQAADDEGKAWLCSDSMVVEGNSVAGARLRATRAAGAGRERARRGGGWFRRSWSRGTRRGVGSYFRAT
jgi:hypothetical protein